MSSEVHPLRLVVKALILFILVNIVYGLVDPSLGGISAYNTLFPGRVRFPFGNASNPYTVTVDDLEVMTASHAISAPKKSNEYRVVVIGDSSVWGETSSVRETITEQWNKLDIQCNDQSIEFYNLGYPHPSVVKDMIILDKAMEYEPDLIIWFVTLNSIVPRRLNPFIAANSERTMQVFDEHDLSFSHEEELARRQTSFYDKTLIGRRSELARMLKLQVLGLVWTATGQDRGALLRKPDLDPDVKASYSYRGWESGVNLEKKMLFEILRAGQDIAESTPVLLINEPIYIATGQNKDIRYNIVYPRWAFDRYRVALSAAAQQENWNYLDLWDAVPARYFSDTGLHVSATGERMLIKKINPLLRTIACPSSEEKKTE